MSTTQAGQFLNMSGNTVKTYVKKGQLTEHKHSNGNFYFSIDELTAIKNGTPQISVNSTVDEMPIAATADARKRLADAIKAEIQVETLKQTLIPTDLIIEILSAELATVRARLQSLSGRIARHCIGTIAEKTAIIDAAVDEILEEIQVDMLSTRELKAQIKKRQKQSAGSSHNVSSEFI
jgi:dUTPase